MASSFGDDLREMLEATARRLGTDLRGNLQEVQQYASERMMHLSTIVGQTGYQDAVLAEAMSVQLKAAGGVVDRADQVDREIFGVIAGFLAAAARALA